MDTENLFTTDNDFNICKSWLCNSTDGQTYSLCNWFAKKIHMRTPDVSHAAYEDILENCFASQEWEDAVGYVHDFKVDGADTDEEARKMVKRLNDYIGGLNARIDALKRTSLDEMRVVEALVKRKRIIQALYGLLGASVARQYIENIVDCIGDDVVEDVDTAADQEEWGDGDVRIAIGRVLCKRLNIES